jgi:phage FluMu protein Com
MKDLKCRSCGKLFGKIEYGKIEIKCSRCHTINKIDIYSQKVLLLDSKPPQEDNTVK